MGKSTNNETRSLESWIWGAACSIRDAKGKRRAPAPLKLFGQEYIPEIWAIANTSMAIPQ